MAPKLCLVQEKRTGVALVALLLTVPRPRVSMIIGREPRGLSEPEVVTGALMAPR